MLKKLILATFLFGCLPLFAQEFDSIAWKYANTINHEDLSKHLHIIASDEFEGRETGKAGQKKAMNYLIDQFKSYGIKDLNNMEFIQQFDLKEQKTESATLTIEGEEFQLNSDFILLDKSSKSHDITGEFVFIDYGIEEDKYNSYKSTNVKDKGVFIWDGKPKKIELEGDWKMEEKIELAESKGVSVIFRKLGLSSSFLENNKHFLEKPSVSLQEKEESAKPPSIAFSNEAVERLLKIGKLKKKKIDKKGLKTSNQFVTSFELKINKSIQKMKSENVLAYIPGTDKKNEVLVITAHYDHIGKNDSLIFNGADDDGTGTVSLLEIAEAFQLAIKDGHKPRRSILIMPVSGEEKGLLGSKFYSLNPVFPLENTVANLNVDMIGRYDEAHKNDSNYIYLIGADRLSQDLHDLSENVNKAYMNIDLDYTFNAEDDPNRFYYRSDHYNFAKNNVPVIFYFSGVHEDYHKATDTVEKIDFKKTQRVAQLIFLTAWHIANAEERLKLNEAN